MKKILKHIMLALVITFAVAFLAANSFVSNAAAKAKSNPTLYKGMTFNGNIKKLVKGKDDSFTNSISYCDEPEKMVFTVNSKTFAKIKGFPNTPVGDNVTAYYDKENLIVYIYAKSTIFFNSDCEDMFKRFRSLESITDEGAKSISAKNVSNAKYMFQECCSLTTFDSNIIKNAAPKEVFRMFEDCYNLKVVDLSNIDLSGVSDMSEMFRTCSKLEEITWKKFDTSKITDMSLMFYHCKGLKSFSFPGWFEAKNVKDIDNMFDGCTSLETVNFGGLNTSNVISLSNVFTDCSSLKSVNLSQLKTKNVTEMSGLFRGCTSLESVSLKSLDTSNLEYISSMFKNCTSLKNVDLTGFKPSKLRGVTSMFQGCTSIETINLKELDFTNVCSNGSYYNFVTDCDKLKVIISPKNVTRAVPLKATFALDDNGDGKPDNGKKYKSFPISAKSHRFIRLADEKNVGDYSGSEECHGSEESPGSEENKVPTVETATSGKEFSVGNNTYILNADGSATVTKIGASGKVSINTVEAFGKTYPVTTIAENAAKGNKKIKSLTIGSNVTTIGKDAFKGCKKLKSITIRANKKLVIGKGAFKKLPKNATIKIKGLKGNAKKKLVKAVAKQTNATVK
ncbi:BspA family leucine-rich repeat surface protein [Butyrivibrio sp. WCD2001]|uniref:BspA family leucine-rich repeat surface protein n=1 Tax=Butyrivibrio sp. WCD2001 TaxID=1280681 RepID=UPI0003FC4C9D|nr:BspA family leucine-rich repeat surface protein [Butyrivibrio sp. WCD2001]